MIRVTLATYWIESCDSESICKLSLFKKFLINFYPFFFSEAMDATYSDYVNLSDNESVKIIMGIKPDLEVKIQTKQIRVLQKKKKCQNDQFR